jgi:hypothetical protein
VIVAPPLLAGAVNATVALVAPIGVATPIVGAPGTDIWVTVGLAILALLVSMALLATTVNV